MEDTHVRHFGDCLVPLTVAHVLAECPTWKDVRLRLFPQCRQLAATNTPKEMLAEQSDRSYNIDPLPNGVQYYKQLISE